MYFIIYLINKDESSLLLLKKKKKKKKADDMVKDSNCIIFYLYPMMRTVFPGP